MTRKRDEHSENLVERVFKGHREEGPVCSSPLVTVTLEQMRTSGFFYPTAHTDPRAMAMLSSFVFTYIGFQGIRVPFDLCVEAEAFGCKVRKGDSSSPPLVIEKAFEERDSLLVPENIFQKGRFEVVFEAIRILNNEFGNEVTIFPGMVGPLTLVGFLYDTSTVMRWPIKDPQRLDHNLEKAADFLAEYANRLSESGGNVLAILDPTASGDLLSRKYFERHMMPIYQRMRENIQGPIVLHICGNTTGFLDLLPQTGFEAFSFEAPEVSVSMARQEMGDNMVLVGNIPTYDILLFGTPDKVREESLTALKEGVDVLAPACGVPVQTPSENLRAMVRAVEEFRGNSENRGILNQASSL